MASGRLCAVLGVLFFAVTARVAAQPKQGAAGLTANTSPLDLPTSLAEPAELHDASTGMRVRFALSNTTKVSPEVAGNVLRYRAALEGETLERHLVPGGVEDFVTLRPGSALDAIHYEIDLRQVAGLRLVGRALEFLDARGAPRLRVAPPFLVDRDGLVHEADLSLEGCNADHLPAAPWGRPVVAPGSDHCTVAVSWDPAVAHAGAVLDPAWTTTQNMAVAREDHSATLLDDDTVLVVGEAPLAGTGQSAELFDPTTGTWAMTGSANDKLNGNEAVRFAGSKVAVIASSNTEIYDPSTGAFTTAPPLNPSRIDFAVAPLPDGSVLVTGGDSTNYLDSAVRLDAATVQWVSAGTMHEVRARHTATALADGRVLVVGGVIFGKYSNTAELYMPTTGAWVSTAGGTSAGHATCTATRLADGRVLVFGGPKIAGNVADIFDPQTGTWSVAGYSIYTHYFHNAVALSDGSAMVIGGSGHDNSTSLSNQLDITETWSPTSKQWVLGAKTNTPRDLFAATLLSDDGTTAKILVTGGDKSEKSAEVLVAKLRGQPCTTTLDCVTGACVDGVCCDATCTSECHACSAALKGAGNDGECGSVALGTDPKDTCPTEAQTTCGKTGVCDGAGTCALYAAGSECQEGVCYTDQVNFLEGWSYLCDGAGSCEKQIANCCYKDGQKVDYCQCDHGACLFGPGGSSSGGSGGGGAVSGSSGSGGSGNFGSGGVGVNGGGSSSSSGCGCRSAPSRPTKGELLALLAALGLAAIRRRTVR
jgi:MYXO-CTERM domain-containing protein